MNEVISFEGHFNDDATNELQLEIIKVRRENAIKRFQLWLLRKWEIFEKKVV